MHKKSVSNWIETYLQVVKKRLNRSATILHRFLSAVNFLLVLMRGPTRSRTLDPAVITAGLLLPGYRGSLHLTPAHGL